jgi:hypothetical protein
MQMMQKSAHEKKKLEVGGGLTGNAAKQGNNKLA